MKIILSIFILLMSLLPSHLYALSDGNYYLEDRNPSNPNIDEKHVGRLSTATPYNKVKEKKITKYYKRMGVLEDGIWHSWLKKNYSEVYIIQKGDTLWDISDKFLDSPWYWPKIWEMNKYITNPHWIYPGNELKFSYSGKYGPSITVILRGHGLDYSVLERDKIDSLFDENDFYKSSYYELLASNSRESQSVLKGGNVCLGEKPLFAGMIESSSKGTTMFGEDDEIDIKMENMKSCTAGSRFAVIEEVENHVYKIDGLIEIGSKAVKQGHCNAKVVEIYSLVKRDMHFIDIPVFHNNPKNLQDVLIADIYAMEPYKKELGSENDRVCVRFRQDKKSPEPGTMVYFYEIKDPVTGKEIDPHVLAAGQIIHMDKSYATVLIVASKKERPVTKQTVVTTRF